MFHPRASAQSRAAVLAVVFAVAGTGCATARLNGADGMRAPLAEPSSLSPAEERQAQALAEYATGVSEEIQGDFDAAIGRYQQALEFDPHNAPLAIRLGRIYTAKRDITNAVSVLESSVKANPNDAEVLFWLGSVYAGDNQNDKAAAAFRQALKLDPANLGALGGLLEIQLGQDSATETVKLLDRAFHQKGGASGYWLRLGDIYAVVTRQKPTWSQKVDRKRIQQCYEKALALSPDDADIEMRLADAYADSGNLPKAVDLYTKLLARDPEAPLIRHRLAASYLRADQKEKAAAVMEEIIKREPLAFGTYNDLGELYADLGKTEKAISNYQQSLVINSNQPDVFVQISALQLDTREIDQTLQTLAAWKARFPTDFRVPYFTGLIQTDQKRYAAAVASFADAESLAHDSPETKLSARFYFSYGAACERSGDPDKAVSLFRKALEIEPENHTTCNYLGYMWADKGVHLDEALRLIQKAVKLEPDNGAYLDSLGWVLFKLGRNEEALVQLRRAVTLIKDDAVVFEHLADVLLKLGKTDEAIPLLRRANELEPGNKGISEKLEKLKADQSAAH
jgi:tetratricopeptide (TPR) repeat protein